MSRAPPKTAPAKPPPSPRKTSGSEPQVKPRVETLAQPLDELKEKRMQEWEPRVSPSKAMYRTDGLQYPVVKRRMKDEDLPKLIQKMRQAWLSQPTAAMVPSPEEQLEDETSKLDVRLMGDDDCSLVEDKCMLEKLKRSVSGIKRLLNSGPYPT